MGKVIKKSFIQVRRDIVKKADKLLTFLLDNHGHLYSDDWTRKHNSMYEKLNELCYNVSEEIDNLDEIKVPEFEKDKG